MDFFTTMWTDVKGGEKMALSEPLNGFASVLTCMQRRISTARVGDGQVRSSPRSRHRRAKRFRADLKRYAEITRIAKIEAQ